MGYYAMLHVGCVLSRCHLWFFVKNINKFINKQKQLENLDVEAQQVVHDPSDNHKETEKTKDENEDEEEEEGVYEEEEEEDEDDEDNDYENLAEINKFVKQYGFWTFTTYGANDEEHYFYLAYKDLKTTDGGDNAYEKINLAEILEKYDEIKNKFDILSKIIFANFRKTTFGLEIFATYGDG